MTLHMGERLDFPSGKNVYFLDTSVLIHDPEIAERLSADDNVVVLSIFVLLELDRIKKSQDEKGANSRAVSRYLDEYRKIGQLNLGVSTRSGGTIVVDCCSYDRYFETRMRGLEKTVDNRIIASALYWWENEGSERAKYKKITILSKDINLRVAANAFGVHSEDYESDRSLGRIDELYTGIAQIELPEEDTKLLLVSFPANKKIGVGELSAKSAELLGNLFSNQCLVIQIADKTILAIYKKRKNELVWVNKPGLFNRQSKGKKGRKSGGNHGNEVVPKNLEQCFEHALLIDEEIPIVTVVGKAGTGKTLISLLAGIEQLGGKYQKVLVYRPNIEIGSGLGFLPGDLGEKFSPWAQPILDNLELIVPKGECRSSAKDCLSYVNNRLEIHPINFIRGRSLNHSFVIVDEVQNLTWRNVKTIITRAGVGTKFVLTGDCTQIDTPYLDAVSNGLAFTVERLKGQELFGSIMLRRSERSELVEMVTSLM